MEFKIVPDGALFDRFGEFAYGDKQWVKDLFEHDPGYAKAVADIVQTLAVSAKVVIGNIEEKPRTTGTLAQKIQEVGRLRKSELFPGAQQEKRKAAGHEWVAEKWNEICTDLKNRRVVREAIAGHLRREFHYAWLKKDTNWTGSWLSPEAKSLQLPAGVLKQFVAMTATLAKEHNFEMSEDQIRVWISQNVTSHYRIFGEYFLLLGDDTEHEYLPAHTRSCLGFLNRNSTEHELDRVVMPFIGLAALKKVKHRADLVGRVVEWGEKEGKEIVDGFKEMRMVYDTLPTPAEQAKEIKRIEAILNSRYSKNELTGLNLLKVITSQLDGGLQALLDLRRPKTYRWLWRIQDREGQSQWRARLRELLQ